MTDVDLACYAVITYKNAKLVPGLVKMKVGKSLAREERIRFHNLVMLALSKAPKMQRVDIIFRGL